MSRTHKIAIAAGLWLALGGVAAGADLSDPAGALRRSLCRRRRHRRHGALLLQGARGALRPAVHCREPRPARAPPSARTSSPSRRPTATPSCSAPSSTYAIAVSLYKKLPYDPAKDFAPIALVAAAPFVLIVHPSLPVHSVADLVRFLKANPGFNYASGGVGSQHHVNAELFRSMAGLDIKNVSYRGGGPAVAGRGRRPRQDDVRRRRRLGARTDPRRPVARAGGDDVVPGRHHARHPDHARGRHHRL